MEQKIHAPRIDELPTTKQLNRATLITAGVATLLLVTTVFPAEYGIDPTGVGRLLNLTEMGEMKRAQTAASPAEVDTSNILLDAESVEANSSTDAATRRSGEITMILQPNEGGEVKASMTASGEFAFAWSTDGAPINWEIHGEKFGARKGDYTSYGKGTSAGQNGGFRAPFDGTHGWFWRNRSGGPITVTVRATGAFQKFARVAQKPEAKASPLKRLWRRFFS